MGTFPKPEPGAANSIRPPVVSKCICVRHSCALLIQPRLSHLDCRVRCAGSTYGAEINVGLPGASAIIVDNDSTCASGLRSCCLAVAGALECPGQGNLPARKEGGGIPEEAAQRATDRDAVPCRAGIGASSGGRDRIAGSIGERDAGSISCCRRCDVRGQCGGTDRS